MLKSICIVFLFVWIPLFSWGSPSSSLSMKDQIIQETMQNLCGYRDKIIFAGHFYNKAAESMRKEVELTLTTFNGRWIKNREETAVQSQYMYDFINSAIFYSEMRNCYSDESERNQVVFLMLWADAAGQFTGAAQVGASFWGVYRALGLLGKGLFLSLSKVLSRFHGAPLAMSEGQFLRYFSWATTLFPAGFMLSDLFASAEGEALVPIEKTKIELEGIQKQAELVLKKLSTLERGDPGYCVYNDLAYNFAQSYFSILREMKSKKVDLKVFGDTAEFRRKIRTLKLCK